MGLTADEFVADIETVKDLSKVWTDLENGRWSASSSVLLDDEPLKCASPITLLHQCLWANLMQA